MPLQHESPTALFLSIGVQYPDFFLACGAFFSPAAPYLLHTMVCPQQNAPSSTAWRCSSASSPQLNAGGCSNGFCTMLPSRERYCVRIPQGLACHPLPYPKITHLESQYTSAKSSSIKTLTRRVLGPKGYQTPVSFRPQTGT